MTGRWPPPARIATWLRAHRYFAFTLCAGIVLRALAMVAYGPALELNGDSYSYLATADHLRVGLWHPIVYPVFLRLLAQSHALVMVPLTQHLLGLATGVLVYLLVRRLGVGDLGATLAAAPVLLDALQLDVEQFVLAEPLFGLLLVAGIIVLLLPRRRRWWTPLLGGALLATATLTRTVGVAPSVIVLLGLALRREGSRQLAMAGAAFVAPLLLYATVFDATYGSFALQGDTGRQLYGVAATFADCHKLRHVAASNQLCPPLPVAERPGNNEYTWSARSPLNQLRLATPKDYDQVAHKWARSVIRRQPLDYLRYVGGNAAHYFAPGRSTGARQAPAAAWEFPAAAHPRPWNIDVAGEGFFHRPTTPRFHAAPARWLRGFERIGYTPGPALLLAVLLAGAGFVFAGAGRRRDVAVLALAGLSLLVAPVLATGFSYRYLIPALPLLASAGVLGAVLLRKRFAATWSSASWRAAAIGLTAVAVGSNALASSVVPVSRQIPTTFLRPGAVATLHDGLAVRLGKPELVSVACAVAGSGTRTWHWRVALPVEVTAAGPARLVQTGNVSWSEPQALPRRAQDIPGSRGLPDILVSRAHPRVTGRVGLLVGSRTWTVKYVDPSGAGVAGWRYSAATTSTTRRQLGAPCAKP